MIVFAILAGHSFHASPAIIPHISLPVSPGAFSTAISSSAPVLHVVFSSAPIASAFMPVSSATTMVRQSSPELALINHQSSVPEPVASNTTPRGPVIALLRQLFGRRDAELAKLDEAAIAHEERVLELESLLSTVASAEAMRRSQVATLQASLSSSRAQLTTARSSADSAISALNVMGLISND